MAGCTRVLPGPWKSTKCAPNAPTQVPTLEYCLGALIYLFMLICTASAHGAGQPHFIRRSFVARFLRDLCQNRRAELSGAVAAIVGPFRYVLAQPIKGKGPSHRKQEDGNT